MTIAPRYFRVLAIVVALFLVTLPIVTWSLGSRISQSGQVLAQQRKAVRQEQKIADSVRAVVLLFCQNNPSGRVLLVNFVHELGSIKHPTKVQREELATLRRSIPIYDQRVVACNKLSGKTGAN